MYQFFSRPDRYIAWCGDLRCTVVERRIPGAPAFLRGLRVLFVSDVHVRPRTTDSQIADFAGRLAALKPDLALWGGDYADRAAPAVRLFERLHALKPPLGSFGVLGNNDTEAWPDIDRLREVMARAGIRLLVNEFQPIALDGGTLIVAGIHDYRHGDPDAAGLYPGPKRDRYRILLSHYPILPDPRPDLMLSGHTHGGQFNLLGFTPFTIGFERIFASRRASRYIAGLHRDGDAQVLVSKGIGASRLPLRIGVRPEVELLAFE